MSENPEVASRFYTSAQRKKGFEGERIFREYCNAHGIILSSNFDSVFNRELSFIPPPLVCEDESAFDTEIRKLIDLYGKHGKPPTIQDYHYKIMKDRGLLGEKCMGAIDYCSFENMSLYEVKHWTKKPSFSVLTSAQKEAMRVCIGKWKCFIVWVKGNKEIELIEVKKHDT